MTFITLCWEKEKNYKHPQSKVKAILIRCFSSYLQKVKKKKLCSIIYAWLTKLECPVYDKMYKISPFTDYYILQLSKKTGFSA